MRTRLPSLMLAGLALAACPALTACPSLTEPGNGAGGGPPPVRQEPGRAQPEPPHPMPTAAATAAAPASERASASHILIAYKGAMRAAPGVKRDKAAAKKLATDLLARLKKGEHLADLAEKYSDDPTAKGHGGALASFTRGAMVKPFSDAAFSLAKGQLSGVVETDFGFHLIQRTE